MGFLVLGIGLHFASTRTIANSYNKYLRQAAASVSSAANEMSEGSGGYISVQGNLKKAIETNPSDERAWIYLTRLYRSDRQITHTENSEITKLMHQYQKNFERNNSGYAQFCMEWGRDLFFLYKNGEAEDGAMGSGDPTLAKTYLQRVVGENPDEKTMEKQKKLLENSHPDSGSFVASYKINEVSEEEAQAQFHLIGPFDFIIEGKKPMAFAYDPAAPLFEATKPGDYKTAPGSHGGLPWLDHRTTFFGCGPAFAQGAVVERASLVDEAPTMARILGFEMEDIDGHCLTQLLADDLR